MNCLDIYNNGEVGFSLVLGEGFEPPKTGGDSGKGLNSQDQYSVTMNSGAKGAENCFEH